MVGGTFWVFGGAAQKMGKFLLAVLMRHSIDDTKDTTKSREKICTVSVEVVMSFPRSKDCFRFFGSLSNQIAPTLRPSQFRILSRRPRATLAVSPPSRLRQQLG